MRKTRAKVIAVKHKHDKVYTITIRFIDLGIIAVHKNYDTHGFIYGECPWIKVGNICNHHYKSRRDLIDKINNDDDSYLLRDFPEDLRKARELKKLLNIK